MAEHEAAWLTHKLLIVETFAVLFRALAALFLPQPDPARRPGIAKPQCRQYALICMVMLPVQRWRVGSTLKEAALLCPSSSIG